MKTEIKKERISNRKQLKSRINQLNKEMDAMEDELKVDLNEVHQSLQAANMIRNAIKDIREQPELKAGIAQAAADLGAHALIDSVVFRKKKGLKNYLISILLKKAADHFILSKWKPYHKDSGKVQLNGTI
jgi:hypothetical protein